MITVKDLLNKKGYEYWYVKPQSTIFEALQKMAEKDIGALMVIDNTKLVGMFSERDYARKIVLHGKSSKEVIVSDYMTKIIVTVKPQTSIYDCMALMTEKRVRHLPVLDHNEIQGIVSIGDVVNAVIKHQDVTIKNLENYITGSGYGTE
ncbi:MAG: CBS domain-containing protein [Bacteroidales bacterium]|nr:CBS domain-containing protein [Bacteroidales bacterium]